MRKLFRDKMMKINTYSKKQKVKHNTISKKDQFQAYLRELLYLEVLETCQPLRDFLEIDNYIIKNIPLPEDGFNEEANENNNFNELNNNSNIKIVEEREDKKSKKKNEKNEVIIPVFVGNKKYALYSGDQLIDEISYSVEEMLRIR